jgi:lysyl-tRNA synthetase class 2
MPALDSSAIQYVNYDDARHSLFVVFSTERKYIYLDVPEEIYRAFLTAPSAGRFFNAEIRDHYRFQEVN